jgi:hypothetical protein
MEALVISRDQVLEALRAEDVAAHYDIKGPWRGRWMRAPRCFVADHGGDAMGLARDGMWHCHSCDDGGDLLKGIALAERLDIKADFRKVIEVAAAIAGVEDEDNFGETQKPPKPERPKPPALPSLAERVAIAKKRAAWLWANLTEGSRGVALYLEQRGLDAAAVCARETIKTTPLAIERSKLTGNEDREKLGRMFSVAGIAIPVRHVVDGSLVDVRVRRFEPRPDQPKVIGMLGGVVSERHELVGCYGNPHLITSDCVVVVEGVADYLTALQIWPHADVLGATHAGVYPLVARHAAKCLGQNGGGTVILVAQRDFAGDDAAYKATWKDANGKPVDGAADRAVDEATKNVISLLGVYACAWVECAPHKDLNDRWRAGDPIQIGATPQPDIVPDDEFG